MITPKALADELGVTPLQIRELLRARFPRSEVAKWDHWQVSDEMAAVVRAHFGHSVKVPSWEIELIVSGVKDEHAAYVARQLFILQRIFGLDGTDVETTIAAERNHDGVERIYELIPDEDAS